MTAAANGAAPEPFDLDAAAAKAAADEGGGQPFPFRYKGVDYSAPPASTWPLEVNRLVGRGDLERALGMLLGDEQYNALVDAGITVGELGVLFGAIGEAAGVGGLPNSSPPVRRASTRT